MKSLTAACLLAAAATGTTVLPAADEPLAAAPSLDVRVMTFNIKQQNPANRQLADSPNHWDLRKTMVFDIIREKSPDIVGLQEAYRSQLDDLATALPRFGEIGEGRDGETRGEYCSILTKKDVGTGNRFSGRVDGPKSDYTFVMPGTRVLKATIIRTHRDGRYPSDHFPVTAGMQIDASAAPSKEHEIAIAMPGAGDLRFRLLPAGRFMMGSPVGEQDGGKDERPLHEVVLSRPFHLAVHEVTCAQWKLVMGSLPEDAGADPVAAVAGVLWQDCQAFLRKLAEQGFGTFRLPTEAEWEYACRAGSTSRFYWGDDPDYSQADAHAWHKGNAKGRTHPVGQKKPNAWGIHDMSGNAWEWCSDWYGPYPNKKQVDPSGPKTGKVHVLRGNGRRWGPRYCRSANRFNRAEGHTTGLRLVLVRQP